MLVKMGGIMKQALSKVGLPAASGLKAYARPVLTKGPVLAKITAETITSDNH
jgi:hypothetical protein